MKHLTNYGMGVVWFRSDKTFDNNQVANFITSRMKHSLSDFTVTSNGDFVHQSGKTFSIDEPKPPRRFFLLEEKQNKSEKLLTDQIDNFVMECLQQYIDLYPEVRRSLWWKSLSSLAVYSEKCFMKMHQDNWVGKGVKETVETVKAHEFRPIFNVLSLSLVLDDHSKGGEMHFKNIDLTIKLKPGELVLFPSSFIGAHEVKPVEQGKRTVYLQFFGHGEAEQGATNLLLDVSL